MPQKNKSFWSNANRHQAPMANHEADQKTPTGEKTLTTVQREYCSILADNQATVETEDRLTT